MWLGGEHTLLGGPSSQRSSSSRVSYDVDATEVIVNFETVHFPFPLCRHIQNGFLSGKEW
jgi:hypothetical protein